MDQQQQVEQIRAKAARLRLLLNRADDRKELVSRVNEFFDSAVAQIAARRSELLAEIESHTAPPDRLISIANEAEQLASAKSPSAASTVLLGDIDRRMDGLLACESDWLEVGRFDPGPAYRRLRRVLDRLGVAWRDEWLAMREADNPFTERGDASDAPDVEDDSDDDSCAGEDSNNAESGKVAPSSAYQLSSPVVAFGSVLRDGDVKTNEKQKQKIKPEKMTKNRPKLMNPNPMAPDNHRVHEKLPSNRPLTTTKMDDFNTRGSPISVAFLHGVFYVLEGKTSGGVVRVYDRRGRFKHPLSLRAIPDAQLHRVRVCHQRSWLLLIDRSASKVYCMRNNGTVDATFGPTFTKRFSFDQPEDAVCTDDQLFVCCPSVGIFVAALDPQLAPGQKPVATPPLIPHSTDNDSGSDGRRVSHSNRSLGLTHPVRMSWNYAEKSLVVLDRESSRSPTVDEYSVHRFRLEPMPEGGRRLVRHCSGPPVLLQSPAGGPPPSVLTFRGVLMLAMRDSAGVGRVFRHTAAGVFDQPPIGSPEGSGLRWLCQSQAQDWDLTDACYMNSQEFAVSDTHGVCILPL